MNVKIFYAPFLSVGGGNLKDVSVNIIDGIKFSQKNSMSFWNSWHEIWLYSNTWRLRSCNSEENKFRITPHSESFQSVVWHCLVSHLN